jgi:hypothetical protein
MGDTPSIRHGSLNSALVVRDKATCLQKCEGSLVRYAGWTLMIDRLPIMQHLHAVGHFQCALGILSSPDCFTAVPGRQTNLLRAYSVKHADGAPTNVELALPSGRYCVRSGSNGQCNAMPWQLCTPSRLTISFPTDGPESDKVNYTSDYEAVAILSLSSYCDHHCRLS